MWYFGVLDCWFNEKHLSVAVQVISYHCWMMWNKRTTKWICSPWLCPLHSCDPANPVPCVHSRRVWRASGTSVKSVFYHNLLYRLILLHKQNISNVSFRCLSVTVKEIVNMRPPHICATALFLLAHVFIIALHCGFLPLTLQNSCVCTGSCDVS